MPLPPTAPLPIQAPGHDDSYREHSPVHEYPSDYERSQDESGALSYAGRFGSGAEDAAHELERSVLEGSYDYPDRHAKHKPSKVKELSKRPASETNSDFDAPKKGDDKMGPALKKRKLDANNVDVHEPVGATGGLSSSAISKLKGRGKQIQREASYDSLSLPLTPKSSRKKATKKKFGLASEFELEPVSRAPSASGDVTPAISRPASPAVSASAFVYELDEQIPPLKKAKKMDESAVIKRVKALEEAQRKVWTNIARRDIAKVWKSCTFHLHMLSSAQVYKYHALGHQSRQSQMERIAKVASIQARRPFTKTAKANKDIQGKAKRLMREMQVFWKKNEKEERDVRKREQKEASDRLKLEEERREAARQARKLEFLISQTELYSHFVGSKLKSGDICSVMNVDPPLTLE
jgi:DNA helicase INO80